MLTGIFASFEAGKLVKRLCRLVGEAIGDYGMIEAGDRVMVCLSGGKDSYGLLDILLSLQDRSPVPFEIVAVNLDQKQPDFPEHVLPRYLSGRGVAFRVEEQDTYSVVKRVIPEGKTMCGLCSRLRRGVIYRVAGELGATKIALGHHRDDILETAGHGFDTLFIEPEAIATLENLRLLPLRPAPQGARIVDQA